LTADGPTTTTTIRRTTIRRTTKNDKKGALQNVADIADDG